MTVVMVLRGKGGFRSLLCFSLGLKNIKTILSVPAERTRRRYGPSTGCTLFCMCSCGQNQSRAEIPGGSRQHASLYHKMNIAKIVFVLWKYPGQPQSTETEVLGKPELWGLESPGLLSSSIALPPSLAAHPIIPCVTAQSCLHRRH